jgi:ATP-dependent Clp protease ATP-binding subunit ClpA
VDDIIIFDILPIEAIREIVKIQVDLVRDRLVSKDISLELSPEAYEYLAKEGYNPQYGARPLKRLIQNKILNPIASLIISKNIMKGGVVSVSVKKGAGKDGGSDLVFDVKKGRRGALIEASILDTPVGV